ncbi:MAG: hypothetical protein ACEPOV_03215 [Hyphomicrobiales bacterium]
MKFKEKLALFRLNKVELFSKSDLSSFADAQAVFRQNWDDMRIGYVKQNKASNGAVIVKYNHFIGNIHPCQNAVNIHQKRLNSSQISDVNLLNIRVIKRDFHVLSSHL